MIDNSRDEIKVFLLRLIALLILLLCAIPYTTKSYIYFIPMAEIVLVFYWTIHNPALFSPGMIVTLGLMQDLISGSPLGISSLVNILTQVILLSQRRLFIKAPFIMVWLGFMLFCIISCLIKWLIMSAIYGRFFTSPILLTQILVTICAYPLLTTCLSYIYSKLRVKTEYA